MALEIQRGKSKWFYARFTINGKHCYHNLRVQIEGTPPQRLRDEGDIAFERCRLKAMIKHDELEMKLKAQGNTEELFQKILEARTGERMHFLPLSELAERWKSAPRRRNLSERYEADSMAVIGRFVIFLQARYPSAKEMAAVTYQAACDFMKLEDARGISPKRYNDVLKLLRSCFTKYRKEAGMADNPFAGIPTKDPETIHRHPFTAEEITALIQAAAQDQSIYPLVVIAITTAMRLGDCVSLSWEHLKGDFLDVRTGKTNQWVTIPVFPILRTLLDSQSGPKKGVIFPALYRKYQTSPEGLLTKVRNVMKTVGFGDGNELNAQGEPKSKGAFHKERKKGLRLASVRDIHSFRVTWVTLALNAGVPIDLVRKVTGHQTVEVVLRSYHQPGREDYRRELMAKLPQVLTGIRPSPVPTLAEIRAVLLNMSESTWMAKRDELIKRLPG